MNTGTIIFRNISSGSLQFDNISVPDGYIASSASVTASSFNKDYELQSDEQTRNYIQSGLLVVGDGTNDFDLSGSLNYLSAYLSPYSIDNALSDGELLYLSGSTFKGISSSLFAFDTRFYNKSSVDPFSPPPQDGDRYYNTSMHLELVYDGFRNKWLSNESAMFLFARDGATPAGSYFRSLDGIRFTDNKGFVVPFSGTIVAIGYSRENTGAAVFEITQNGSLLSFISSSALSGTDYSINNDFNANQTIGARNKSGGNIARDVQGWIRIKWRT